MQYFLDSPAIIVERINLYSGSLTAFSPDIYQDFLKQKKLSPVFQVQMFWRRTGFREVFELYCSGRKKLDIKFAFLVALFFM